MVTANVLHFLRFDVAGMIPLPTISFQEDQSMLTNRHGSFYFLIIAVIFSLPLCAGSQTAPSKVPLTHEAMWMMKRVGAPVPSPDGKWVVFSLVEPGYDEKDQVVDLSLIHI